MLCQGDERELALYYLRADPEHGAILDQLGVSVPYLLYVGGRYAACKTFARLAGAFAKCPRDLRLSLVESPPDAILRVLYSLVAPFVYPSRHDGFGIPLLEARACGAPVIAARTAPFLEVAGDAPLSFGPDDTARLAEGIQTCLDEPDVRKACRRRGGDRLARYSWEATATAMRRAYERAASEA